MFSSEIRTAKIRACKNSKMLTNSDGFRRELGHSDFVMLIGIIFDFFGISQQTVPNLVFWHMAFQKEGFWQTRNTVKELSIEMAQLDVVLLAIGHFDACKL